MGPNNSMHVDRKLADCPGNGSPASPYCTLTTAVHATAPGDVITLHNGFYPETLAIDKRLTLTASGGPAIVGRQPEGTIQDKWMSLGGYWGPLGSPSSEEQSAPDGSGARIQYFEHGTIRLQAIPAPLTFFEQNLALIGGPGWEYKGMERERVPGSFISYMRREQPDLIGLCEVFYDNERDEIRSGLRDIYPYAVDAPEGVRAPTKTADFCCSANIAS